VLTLTLVVIARHPLSAPVLRTVFVLLVVFYFFHITYRATPATNINPAIRTKARRFSFIGFG
jgi:hypothetical protein